MTKSCQVLVAMMLMVVVGCGDGTPPIANRISCSGLVTLDGLPLSHGVVGFEPVDPNTGWSATGAIKNGHFEMVTTASAAGAVIGKYQVRVLSEEQAPAGLEDKLQRPKSLIPEKYNDINRSGLEVEVTKGMKPIELKLLSQ
ncbi:MAG TPA: hypothetical protein VNQ76_19375 [Planctomicrobium sp.]|nr:hypothetical protein [Planctomicrobium sp.]